MPQFMFKFRFQILHQTLDLNLTVCFKLFFFYKLFCSRASLSLEVFSSLLMSGESLLVGVEATDT